jgi:hypothetical protein
LTDRGGCDQIADVVHQPDVELGSDVCGHLVEVRLGADRQGHLRQSGAVGSEQLLLDPPIGSTRPLRVTSPVMPSDGAPIVIPD